MKINIEKKPNITIEEINTKNINKNIKLQNDNQCRRGKKYFFYNEDIKSRTLLSLDKFIKLIYRSQNKAKNVEQKENGYNGNLGKTLETIKVEKDKNDNSNIIYNIESRGKKKEKNSKLIKYQRKEQIKKAQNYYFFILLFLFLIFIKTIFSLPEELPKFFDLREKYNQCQSLFTIRNQGNCGCCWASATTSVISDKICINSNGNNQEYISETELNYCEK